MCGGGVIMVRGFLQQEQGMSSESMKNQMNLLDAREKQETVTSATFPATLNAQAELQWNGSLEHILASAWPSQSSQLNPTNYFVIFELILKNIASLSHFCLPFVTQFFFLMRKV